MTSDENIMAKLPTVEQYQIATILDEVKEKKNEHNSKELGIR